VPVQADVAVEVDLAPGHVGEPTSIAPDIWWDATPRLTLGLVHSNASVDRIQPGATFCIGGTDPLACDHVYRGSGLDVMYRLEDWIAPRARFLLRDIEPVKPALLLGARIDLPHVTFDPYLQIGLLNMTEGNRSAVVLPVRAHAALGPAQLWVDTGWNAELVTYKDAWHVPLGLGASTHVVDSVSIGAELGFRTLLGPQNTPKERVLFVFVSWR
jgi:hypothetical protein